MNTNDDMINNSLTIPPPYNGHQQVQASFEMGHSAISMSQLQDEHTYSVDYKLLQDQVNQRQGGQRSRHDQ